MYIPTTAPQSMDIEHLRNTLRKYDRQVTREQTSSSEHIALNRKDIRRRIQRIYTDTGEFMGLLNKSLNTASFEIEKSNFSESGLPQPIVDFFETQYELMPEDITFEISAKQDMNKNHNIYLRLKRRGYTVSRVHFCSYVRQRGEMATRIWTHLDYEEMQPLPSVEAKNRISNFLYSGNNLVDDTTHLKASEAILEFSVNEAVKHIQSQIHGPTELVV